MAIQFPSDAAGNTPYTDPGTGYIYDWDGQKWNGRIESGASSTPIEVGDTPPGSPEEGDLWWNSADGRLYIYYNDGNTNQWVDASPPGSGAEDYVLPTATDTVLGGIKVGARLTITDGVLSADNQGGGGAAIGSLQEVTDVGNTTDNNIVVGAGGYGTAADGTTILPGYLRLTGATGTPLNIYKTDDTDPVIKFGVDGSGTFADNKIKLNAGGSAEFAGTIQSGDYTSSDGGVAINFAGNITIRNDSATAKPFRLFRGGTDESTNLMAVIHQDGSADFSGNVTSVSPSDYGNSDKTASTLTGGALFLQKLSTDTSTALGVYQGANLTPTVDIQSNGTATFANVIKSESAAGTFAALNPGYIVIQQPGTESDDLVFRARNSVGSEVIEFFGDGSATFAGQIDIDGTGGFAGYGWAIANNGSLGNKTPDGTKFYVLNTGELGIDGGNVSLMPDGSATFAGKVTATRATGSISDNTTAFQATFDTNSENHGTFFVKRGGVWIGEDVNNSDTDSTRKTVLKSDGRAEFATGNIKFELDGSASFAGGNGYQTNNSFGIASGGTIRIRKDTAGDQALEVYSGGDTNGDVKFLVQGNGDTTIGGGTGGGNITLNANGNATFGAGWIQIATGVGTNSDPFGGVFINGGTAGNTSDVFHITTGGFITAKIAADGSAEFAGDVICGNNPSDTTTTNGIRLRKDGTILIRNNDATSAFQVYLNGQSDATISLGSDGSAEFAGKISSGTNLANATTAKSEVDQFGTFKSTKGGANTDIAFAAYSILSGKNNIELKADGSATFAGGVTVDGSRPLMIGTGADEIDVKDRLGSLVITYTLTASGSTFYTFNGPGQTNANDPTLLLIRGQTYSFVNNTSGHPFRIQSTTATGGGGLAYNDGVTNQDAPGGETLTFTVPHDAPDTLFYQCTAHSSMTGTLNIVDGNSIATALSNLKTAVAGAADLDALKTAIGSALASF